MKIIIGKGISGLATLFYSGQDTFLIGEGEHKPSPFHFINVSEESIKLFKDLNIPINILSVDIFLPEVGNKEKILQNKIGPEALNKRWFQGTDRLSLAAKEGKMQVLDKSLCWVCKILEERLENRIIRDRVAKILKEENGFRIELEKSPQILSCEEIISTINGVDFEKIYPGWRIGEASPSDIKLLISPFDGKRSSITYEDPKQSGVIKIFKNSLVHMQGREIAKNFPMSKAKPEETLYYMNQSRFSRRFPPPPERVSFIGRGATGLPKWRISDSLFLAQKGNMLSFFLEEQRRFSDQLLKLNKGLSLENKAEKTVLHLFSEVSELLREINWEIHKGLNRKTIKSTSILEEGVDCLKLIFDLFQIFEYSPREIHRFYQNKSETVWNQLLENFYGGV